MYLHFYVYAYLRKSNLTPYYIGKGSGRRAWIQHRKNGKGVSTPKDKSKIVILEDYLTEIGSFAIERKLIRWWGRKDLGTGILHNRTDGGEGSSNLSEITRKKIGDRTRGIPLSKEHRLLVGDGNRGKVRTEEQKRHHSMKVSGSLAWNKGIKMKPCSTKRKEKLSNHWLIYNTITKHTEKILHLKSWCERNNFSYNSARTLAPSGKYKHFIFTPLIKQDAT